MPNLALAQSPRDIGPATQSFSVAPPDVVKASPATHFDSYVARIVAYLIITPAVILFVILILIGGLQWLGSAGDEEASAKAKRLLQNAVVGLFIVLAAGGVSDFLLYQFTGQRGLFGTLVRQRTPPSTSGATPPTPQPSGETGGEEPTVTTVVKSPCATAPETCRPVHIVVAQKHSAFEEITGYNFEVVERTVSSTTADSPEQERFIDTVIARGVSGDTVQLPIGVEVFVRPLGSTDPPGLQSITVTNRVTDSVAAQEERIYTESTLTPF